MTYLLDTDTVSYLLKNQRGVLDKASRVPSDRWAISAISACELESVRGPRLAEGSWKARIEPFLRAVPILPFGAEEARTGGEITRFLAGEGLSSGPYDILIAAQALVAGATLVTHNTRHFDRIPLLRLEDWAAE